MDHLTLHLIDFAGMQFKIIRPLGSTEGAEYRRAVQHLSDFQTARTLLPMIQAELSDFRQAIGRVTAALAEGTLDALHEQLSLDSNRHLLSYLASVRTYLDHTERRLKREYGHSGPFAKFKQARSAAYDQSFAYRFLDQLRNYGQHCGLPIGHVELHSTIDVADGQRRRRAAFGFDPRDLLARGGDTWKKNVRTELSAMTGVLEVDPILEEMASQLAVIEAATLDAERPHLLEAAKPITEVFGEIVKVGGVPAVGILGSQGSKTDVELVRPPKQPLEWLGFSYIGIEL
jgi:hypothetical protein